MTADPPVVPPSAQASGSCSTAKAAQTLGTSVQTIQRWVDRGYLRGWRTPGGHRRVDLASVREVQERARPQVAAAHPPVGGGAPRVMIVDDSPDDLELLSAVAKAVLPRAELLLMSNGFAALAALGQQPPDLLITDVAMPGIDGIEMIRSLRNVPRLAALPVIAISSYTTQELALKFGALPIDLKIMRKPVTPSKLRAAVADIAALRAAA